MRSIARALALVLGPWCAIAAGPAAGLERAAPLRSDNPAVLSLLETAEQALRAGRPEQASTLLERALDIDPRNASAWHYLGVAHLELGHYAQAEAMAAKSHSLGGGDRELRVSNAELLATALRSSGRIPTNAENQVLAAPSTLDVGLERVRRYLDTRSWRERDDAEPLRRSTPAEIASQSWRDVRSTASQRAQAAAQRAEAAAQRAEAAARRAEAEIARRAYRYRSNDVVRRRRY